MTTTYEEPTDRGLAPDDVELLQRTTDLRPLLMDQTDEIEEHREVPERVIDALSEAGIFQLFVPKRLGGIQTDCLTMLEVVAELGRANMSVSWVAGVLNFSAWQVGAFPEEVQNEVWADGPQARVCSVLTAGIDVEHVDGGLILNGRWPFASGSRHCTWAVLTYPDSWGPSGPDLHMAVIPLKDLTIEDTWYPAGVRGSGSNDLVGKDVFVPLYRTLSLAAANDGERPNGHPAEQLYHASWSGIGSMATLAPQLGAARSALELVGERSQRRRIPPLAVADQSEHPHFQRNVGEAATLLDAAWLLARQLAVDTDRAAASGVLPSSRLRGRARAGSVWCSRAAYDVVERLITEAGSSSLMDASPLQRVWRDVATAHRHVAYRSDPFMEMYGRLLLGKDKGPIQLF